MDEFAIHANHNHLFYDGICTQYPDTYFDWKITILFYVAFHYLKALAKHRKKEIGQHHVEINRNIRSGSHYPTMPISDRAYDNYMNLFHYSQTARYEGMPDIATFNVMREADHGHALKCFKEFKAFIVSSGVILEKISIPVSGPANAATSSK
jgi:hypothetical protein